MPDCIVERHGGVMLIRFNRPEKMNSLGGTLMQEFAEAFREGTADDSVRCFVVTGEGRAWNAGADLSGAGITQIGKTKQTFAQEMNSLGGVGQVALQVWNCDKPTIAAVNGVCAGGGFGFVTCFDRRIASDQARFTTVFIRRALASDFGLSWFLPRLVGIERAHELYYSGRIIGADEALELGLVSEVVPHEQLIPHTMEIAQQYAKNPPIAMAYARRSIHRGLSNTLEDHLEYEWGLQAKRLGSDEFREGVAAFLEKREPNWG